jgi:hypothetical protein
MRCDNPGAARCPCIRYSFRGCRFVLCTSVRFPSCWFVVCILAGALMNNVVGCQAPCQSLMRHQKRRFFSVQGRVCMRALVGGLGFMPVLPGSSFFAWAGAAAGGRLIGPGPWRRLIAQVGAGDSRGYSERSEWPRGC